MSSMISALRKEIAEEYAAAAWGLYGIADGTAKHSFITKRLEKIGDCHAALREIVGEDLAGHLMVDTMESSHDELHRVLTEFYATPSYVQRYAARSLRIP